MITIPSGSRMSMLSRYSGFSRIIQLCIESPWFAYLTIFLLQLKRVWGAWQYRDLTMGDTSYYFPGAYGWAKEFSVSIVWSPLYTAYYGTVFKAVPDVYLATLLHRLLIVFVLSIMILAIMRRLLPPIIAWLVTAWWVILPINFDTLFEVHLFAIILPLISVLLLLYRFDVWMRASALGVLLASVILVRNEIIIAMCLWILACIAWELRQVRLKNGKGLRTYLLAYGVSILLAGLIITFFNWRTLIKPDSESIKLKHTLNVCQIYAFGYQQRHKWEKSPWTECERLMVQKFGRPLPTMIQAIQTNPHAMLEHFRWNIHLLPAGLQVALFNATSEHDNPDYAPVKLDRPLVLIPSITVIAIIAIGLIILIREIQYWWAAWLKERVWGWLMMMCLACVMLIVIPMQRPRPSYMFLLTILLMAIVGMCLFVILRRFINHPVLVQGFNILVITMIILVQPYYYGSEQPLLKYYMKLYPNREFVSIPGTAIVTSGYAQELCNYFIRNVNATCSGYDFRIFKDIEDGESVGEFLGRQPIPVVALLLDDLFLTVYGDNPDVQNFYSDHEREGWKLVAWQNSTNNKWQLYVNVIQLNLIAPELPITISDQ